MDFYQASHPIITLIQLFGWRLKAQWKRNHFDRQFCKRRFSNPPHFYSEISIS